MHFPDRAYVAIDVRGGGPGTVNAPYVELGYDIRELDTVVFAGGSWYGLEATTAVASALKDDGIRDGNAFGVEPNVAMPIGSIIFDLGSRRLNEVYTDREVRICSVVTDRDGRVVACYRRPEWPADSKTADLLKHFPESRDTGWPTQSSKNTTVSVLVVNQRMGAVELKRLAVQVHMSMGRALQPYATIVDGDVLYAVSTAELDEPEIFSADISALASELMWDAIRCR